MLFWQNVVMRLQNDWLGHWISLLVGHYTEPENEEQVESFVDQLLEQYVESQDTSLWVPNELIYFLETWYEDHSAVIIILLSEMRCCCTLLNKKTLVYYNMRILLFLMFSLKIYVPHFHTHTKKK